MKRKKDIKHQCDGEKCSEILFLKYSSFLNFPISQPLLFLFSKLSGLLFKSHLFSQFMKSKTDPKEVLTKLFGSVSRARILELLLPHSGRTFYQREIMFETALSLQPTQRELANLLDLGIVKKRETRDRVYYEINTLSPFFKPLCEICGSAQKQRADLKKE